VVAICRMLAAQVPRLRVAPAAVQQQAPRTAPAGPGLPAVAGAASHARLPRGQDGRQACAGDAAGGRLQRASFAVPGRPPARSPQHPGGDQPDDQQDEQRPAERSQPSALARSRRAGSRRRGGRGGWQRRGRRRRGFGTCGVGVVAGRVDVGGSTAADVAGAVGGEVGAAALVRGGRVVGGAVVPGSLVVLGALVPLVAGRVPEGSVEERAVGAPPSPPPQPPSPRTRPVTSPVRRHALAARRPTPKGPPCRCLPVGALRREIIPDVRIRRSTSGSQGQEGSTTGMRRRPFFGGDSPPASPHAGENAALAGAPQGGIPLRVAADLQAASAGASSSARPTSPLIAARSSAVSGSGLPSWGSARCSGAGRRLVGIVCTVAAAAAARWIARGLATRGPQILPTDPAALPRLRPPPGDRLVGGRRQE
jgi:hypothetical protein